WPAHGAGALRELIALEAAAAAPGAKREPVRLAGLGAYVLHQEEYDGADSAERAAKDAGFKLSYDAYKEAQAAAARQMGPLQEVVDWLYADAKGEQEWPPS